MQSNPYAPSQQVIEEKCPARLFLDNVTLLRNVQTIQELHQSVSKLATFVQGPSKFTFRISLFRTLQICWMSAALCETFSREFPESWSSSFWVVDASTSTPGCITTFRTIFSPMKFLCIPSAPLPPFPCRFCSPR